MRMIRRAIIPRLGNQLLELDYKGVEVFSACCYHKDPNMIKYLTNPDMDMHRDMAIQCYMLGKNQWTKKSRYSAKNGFVFPEFYGDWWKTCARAMWDNIAQLKLTTKNGIDLYTHLANKGIHSLEDFEHHIEKVEDDFWNRRFQKYAEWKDDWYDEYEEKGFIDSLTGFRFQGFMSRNEVINYPPQGTAFHCLLWCLIQLQRIAEEEGWKSLIIGQIHDAIVIDTYPEERDHILRTAQRVMCEDIRKHWKWLILPLEIEADISPIDQPWSTMESVTIN